MQYVKATFILLVLGCLSACGGGGGNDNSPGFQNEWRQVTVEAATPLSDEGKIDLTVKGSTYDLAVTGNTTIRKLITYGQNITIDATKLTEIRQIIFQSSASDNIVKISTDVDFQQQDAGIGNQVQLFPRVP